LAEYDDNTTFLELISDYEAMKGTFDASKENLDAKIAEKEDLIRKGLQAEWQKTYNDIMEDQHQRNRNIVHNIVERADEFRSLLSKFDLG